MFLKANAKFIHAKNSVDVASAKIDSREITGEAQFAKMNSREILKAHFAKINSRKASEKNCEN